MHTYRTILETFDESSLPDLDVAVLGALELFSEEMLEDLSGIPHERVLIVGSGNAAVVGKLLFSQSTVYFANESSYRQTLDRHRADIDAVVIISASGGKHAVGIAADLAKKEIPLWLLTNNPQAPAAAHVAKEHIRIFQKNREPYTYNTSTYFGMLLAESREDPRQIMAFLLDTVLPAIPQTLNEYDAFCFIVRPEHIAAKDMLLTKCDELFGSRISARVFAYEEMKHAKTVVPSTTECFVTIGLENTLFGEERQRCAVPFPEGAGIVTFLAAAYFFIGNIQKQHPPYFKENIAAYAKEASEMFGHTISTIVV